MSLSVRPSLEAMHYRSVDQARQELGLPRPASVTTIINSLKPPSRLQFRLRYFNEYEGGDNFAQGPGDEVFMSAVGSDSSSVTVGPDRRPQAALIYSQRIGDVSEDAVRDRCRENPFVLLDFDLRQPGDWPRSYTATLLLVEHDNGDLAEVFEKLHSEVGGAIRTAAVNAAITGAAAASGAAIGTAIPLIGTAVGAAVGALVGATYDLLIPAIRSGLADDVYTPIPITLEITKPWLASAQPGVNVELSQKVRELGADYDIFYDWHIVP